MPTATELLAALPPGEQFTDPEFPPVASSIGAAADEGIEWLRPEQIAGSAQVGLFVSDGADEDAIEAGDIDQHGLGDCWFLASLAGLAEFPQLVISAFDAPYAKSPSEPIDTARRTADLAKGGISVQLNKDGWWTTVTVDTTVPCVDGHPAFTFNMQQPGEMWAAIIEKAYAKLHGSYHSLVSGSPVDALPDLTGFPAEPLDWHRPGSHMRIRPEFASARLPAGTVGEVKKTRTGLAVEVGDEIFSIDAWEPDEDCGDENEELFLELEDFDQKDFIMTLSTPSAAGKSDRDSVHGLSYGHAYTLVTVKKVGRFRMCKIRNPWGNETEWDGDWSDDSALWNQHKDVKEVCNHISEGDGTFWMEWSDVHKYFNSVVVCYTYPRWTEVRVRSRWRGGTPEASLQLTVAKSTEVFLTVSQRDKRGSQNAPEYECAMMVIVSQNEAGKWVVQRSNGGVYMRSRDVTLRATLPAGTHYVVVRRFSDSYGGDDIVPFVVGVLMEHDEGEVRAVSTTPGMLKAFGPSPKVGKSFNTRGAWDGPEAPEAKVDMQVNRHDVPEHSHVSLSEAAPMTHSTFRRERAPGKRSAVVTEEEAARRRKLKEQQRTARRRRRSVVERKIRAPGTGGTGKTVHMNPFLPVSEVQQPTDPEFLATKERIRAELLAFKRQFFAIRGAVAGDRIGYLPGGRRQSLSGKRP